MIVGLGLITVHDFNESRIEEKVLTSVFSSFKTNCTVYSASFKNKAVP